MKSWTMFSEIGGDHIIRALLKSLNIAIYLLFLILFLTGCSGSSDNAAEKRTETAALSSSGVKNLPTLIDLGSVHCKPCKKMAPILDSLRIAYEGKAEIIFIDVRKDKKSARKYGVTMIPTQVFLDTEGNEVHRHVGFLSAQSITSYFKSMGVEL